MKGSDDDSIADSGRSCKGNGLEARNDPAKGLAARN
jgi:hypothetical protein